MSVGKNQHWLGPFLQVFLPKLILEVFGAAGAIWGSSEAVGLRTSATNWFWRPVALSVGILFLARWTLQLRSALFLGGRQESPLAAAAADNSNTQGDEDETSYLVVHTTRSSDSISSSTNTASNGYGCLVRRSPNYDDNVQLSNRVGET